MAKRNPRIKSKSHVKGWRTRRRNEREEKARIFFQLQDEELTKKQKEERWNAYKRNKRTKKEDKLTAEERFDLNKVTIAELKRKVEELEFEVELKRWVRVEPDIEIIQREMANAELKGNTDMVARKLSLLFPQYSTREIYTIHLTP